MADYQNPKAGNAILDDLQEIVALINSGAKMDPTGNTNIPTGAKRVVAVTGGYQIQSYNGTTWVSVGKLMHDCDTLDGKNTNTGTTANTIPVRDQNGALPGNVTGNAATATKLQTARTIDLGGILSATEQSFDGSKPITIPVKSVNVNNENDDAVKGVLTPKHGGTGREDGAASDVVVNSAQGQVLASKYGQIGDARNVTGQDLDTLTVTGDYIATSATVENHFPYATSNTVISIKVSRSTTNIFQTVRLVGEVWQRRSTSTGSSWYAWEPIGGTKTSTVIIYVSKSGTDANTGLSNSYPVQTISRALSVAKGIAPHGYNNVVVRLCLGEGDWGTATFRSLPYMLQLYPFDNTVPTEYSASLPSFENLEVYNSYVQVAGIVATNRIRTNSGTIEVSGGYTRFAEISSQNNSHVIIVGSSNPIEIISKENHTSVFTVGVDSSMYIANERVCNIVENLNLSEGFLFANMNSFVTRFYVMTFTLADGISVTGQKYSLWNRSHCVYGKAELDALPGSEEGVLSNGTLLTNGLWGGGDAHTFMAADATWKKDSSSIYARDVAIGGDASNLAGARGQIGNVGGLINAALNLNDYTDSGIWWVNASAASQSINLPVKETGTFVVYGRTDGTYIQQLYFTFSGSGAFYRYRITGTWSSWKRILTDAEPYAVFTGATSSAAGAKGLVPAPAAGDNNQFLRGDGSWEHVTQVRCFGIAEGAYQDVVNTTGSDGGRSGVIRINHYADYNEMLLGVCGQNNSAPNGITLQRSLEDNSLSINIPGNVSFTGEVNFTNVVNGSGVFAPGDFVWSYRSSKTGFLLCNGAAISRTTYADLYAVIGTKFGAGNGRSTFNLPDMRGKVAWGANRNLGTVLAAGLPNAVASTEVGAVFGGNTGAGFWGANSTSSVIRHGGSNIYDSGKLNLDLSRASSIYGKSTTVQPPAIALNCFIKY